ncbi:hypothetical protein [Qipengyuania nanhaisediminis]
MNASPVPLLPAPVARDATQPEARTPSLAGERRAAFLESLSIYGNVRLA